MAKNIRFLLIFIITGIILFLAGIFTQKNFEVMKHDNKLHQKPAVIANHFLDRLQKAYETKDIPLLVSLYNNPTVAVDVTRNENKFYTASKLQKEIEKNFTGLTGIKCSFTDRQITSADDMIMIRTLRSVTANEIPITANCLMLMVLHRKNWDYIVTDQILLKEEYIKKSSAGNIKKP